MVKRAQWLWARASRWWRSHVPQYRWRTLLKAGALLGAAGIVLALAVSYGGIYNVAASHQHPGWMTWFLELSMERSIKVQSAGIEAPPLDLEDLVPLGAAHFAGTCGVCHAAPGVPDNPVFAKMLPAPPPLADQVRNWSAPQLYWIALHGIQFSGMPAWPGGGREDEVWATVALLLALPEMSPEQYQRHANGNLLPPERGPEGLVRAGHYRTELTACNRCHDTHRMPPTSSWTPRLAGQTETYLYRALLEYRADQRQSGVMEPVAAMLDEAQLMELARYYAQLDSPRHRGESPAAPEQLAQGRALAQKGDPERKVPACDACHSATARADYPRLAGQSRAYQLNQLRLWSRGGRAASRQGQVMAIIAKRMTPEQMEAAAAYYSQTDVGGSALASAADGEGRHD